MAGYLTKFQTKVMVTKGGRCTWMAPATFTSSCKIDVKYWPFDSQICSMTFGSWSYGERYLQYRAGETDTEDDVATKLAGEILCSCQVLFLIIVSFRLTSSKIQSKLYIMSLYIAVTLCITVTEQLPKNHP